MMQKAFGSGPIHFALMPPGFCDRPTAQKVALGYFGAHPKVDDYATFGDQMAAGALGARPWTRRFDLTASGSALRG